MEIAFAWTPFKTIFGTSYLSFCNVGIQAKNRRWLERGLKIDSGADTIMLEKSDLEALGYNSKYCIRKSYTNANNERCSALFRMFRVRIGDHIIEEVPVMFSETPIANLLLGRAKIFESLDIFFDSKTKHTVFATR